MASTKDILDHHLKAFDQGDLNAVLSDYAPDVVFFAMGEAFKGVDAIRPLFEALIVEFRQSGATFKLKQRLVEGDYAYILWTAETADNLYELATDTFVVREGRIVAQSFTAKITPKN
jgi:ketosteroid isomerase-like protein